MELITSKYLKVNKLDLFHEIIIAGDEKNHKKMKFFQVLINDIMQYECEQIGDRIDYIYLSVDDIRGSNVIDVSKLMISRQSLLNAILYATYKGDVDIVKKLSFFMDRSEINSLELGDMSFYVLDHSMDFNEYMEREEKRYIYYVNSRRIEKGYIYSVEKNIKTRRK